MINDVYEKSVDDFSCSWLPMVIFNDHFSHTLHLSILWLLVRIPAAVIFTIASVFTKP
jgi:hypothetical protein